MIDQEDLLDLIFDVLPEINLMLPSDQQLTLTRENLTVPLFGSIDSMGILNFVLTVEGKLGEQLRKPVTIANEDLVSAEGPLKNLQTFLDYVIQVLEETR